MSCSRILAPSLGLVACVVAAPCSSASAQSAAFALSPFVTFLPSSGESPLAGLALTMGGTGGFAIRVGGQLSLQNSNTSGLVGSNGYRPWGADADALFSFGRSRGSIAPYVFAGVGTRGDQAIRYNAGQTNWSYGAGLSLPLAGPIGLFGESRWRMSRFVLPSASNAPSPTNEFRLGVTFHVGG